MVVANKTFESNQKGDLKPGRAVSDQLSAVSLLTNEVDRGTAN
jgi:hypothetical protein